MLRAGFGKADITPSYPLELSGFAARRGKSEGVHDRIYCRALHLEEEKEFTLISCDVLGFDVQFSDGVRQMVASRLGLSKAQVMLAATHTHSAPATMFLRHAGTVDKGYLKLVQDSILQAAEAAQETHPVTMSYAAKRVPGLTVDRVYQSAPDDSLVAIHLNPADKGEKRISIVNFSCHPVVLGAYNKYVSADFPGYVCSYYEREGEETIFLNGASGDLNPFTSRKHEQTGTFQDAERMGTSIAEKSYQNGKELEPSISFSDREVLLEQVRPAIEEETLEREVQAKRQRGDSIDPDTGIPYEVEAQVMEEWLSEVRSKEPGQVKAEAQALKLSQELALVSFSGELFSSVGNLVKLGSPFPETMIVGYANGLVGYIPDQRAFEVGSYEAAEAYKYFDTFPFSKSVSKVAIKAMLIALAELNQ